LCPLHMAPSTSNKPPSHLEIEFTSADGLRYVVQTPIKAPPPTGYPLLLYVHGFGTDPFTNDPPPALIRRREGDALAGTVVVAPYITVDKFCMPEELYTVVQAVISKGGIDLSRLYAAGWSMGGYGVMNLAAHYPDLLAAVVAVAAPAGLNCRPGSLAVASVCGFAPRLIPVWLYHCLGMHHEDCFNRVTPLAFQAGLFQTLPHPDVFETPDFVGRLERVPIWLQHGEADDVISPETTAKLLDALQQAGSKVARRTTHPGADHNEMPRIAFGQRATYQWLFSHAKPAMSRTLSRGRAASVARRRFSRRAVAMTVFCGALCALLVRLYQLHFLWGYQLELPLF